MLLVVCLPAGVYCATHLAVLLQWFHLWSLLLLGAGPLLFVTCLPGNNAFFGDHVPPGGV